MVTVVVIVVLKSTAVAPRHVAPLLLLLLPPPLAEDDENCTIPAFTTTIRVSKLVPTSVFPVNQIHKAPDELGRPNIGGGHASDMVECTVFEACSSSTIRGLPQNPLELAATT